MKIAESGLIAMLAFAPIQVSAAALDAAMAARLVDHCAAAAGAKDLALSIVVLDAGGHVLLAKRMDGARFKTIEVAEGKAYTALSIGAPSALMQQAVDGGKASYLAVPGMVPIRGGLPILHDGRLVGAIGASGAEETEDEACVRDALAAVK